MNSLIFFCLAGEGEEFIACLACSTSERRRRDCILIPGGGGNSCKCLVYPSYISSSESPHSSRRSRHACSDTHSRSEALMSSSSCAGEACLLTCAGEACLLTCAGEACILTCAGEACAGCPYFIHSPFLFLREPLGHLFFICFGCATLGGEGSCLGGEGSCLGGEGSCLGGEGSCCPYFTHSPFLFLREPFGHRPPLYIFLVFIYIYIYIYI